MPVWATVRPACSRCWDLDVGIRRPSLRSRFDRPRSEGRTRRCAADWASTVPVQADGKPCATRQRHRQTEQEHPEKENSCMLMPDWSSYQNRGPGLGTLWGLLRQRNSPARSSPTAWSSALPTLRAVRRKASLLGFPFTLVAEPAVVTLRAGTRRVHRTEDCS